MKKEYEFPELERLRFSGNVCTDSPEDPEDVETREDGWTPIV